MHRTLIALTLATLGLSEIADAYTANKVWMEFRPNGRYRVYVNYTVPEVMEYREAYAEFSHKRKAEKFYFDLVRGADFHLPFTKDRKFVQPANKPEPW